MKSFSTLRRMKTPFLCLFFVLSSFLSTDAQKGTPIDNLQSPVFSFYSAEEPDLPINCTGQIISYNEIQVGDSRTTSFLIRNDGEGVLRIQSIAMEGDAHFNVNPSFGEGEEEILLGAGEEISLTVSYIPTETGAHSAALVVHHNAEGSNPCSILFNGSAIEATPEELGLFFIGDGEIPIACGYVSEFPEVLIGESDFQLFMIKNLGDEPLALNNFTVNGSSDFEVVTSFPVELPYTIPPDFVVVFRATFAPTVEGPQTATFNMYTSAGECSIQLNGTGLNPLPSSFGLFSLWNDLSIPVPCGVSSSFPDLFTGESASKTYLVRNTGDEDLILDNFVVSGSTDFSATASPSIVLPYTMGAGEEIEFTITFAPTIEGDQEAALTFFSEGGQCIINLEGDARDRLPGTLGVFIPWNDITIPVSCGSSFEFLDMFVGDSDSETIIIRNIGDDPLILDNYQFAGPADFSLVSPPIFVPYILQPGQELVFEVLFNPSIEGEQEASLTFYTGGKKCPIKFKGEARERLPGTLGVFSVGDNTVPITCGDAQLEFPDILVGESSSRTILLRNIGDEPLVLENFALSGSTDYALNTPPIFLPYTLDAGEEISIDIIFTPTSPGEKDATLVFYTADRKCPIGLEGGGLAEGEAFLSIFDSEGNAVPCGGTISLEVATPLPGPLLFGFYYTFRNYGTENLLVSGTVEVQGVPGSSQAIETFTVEPLEFIFLNTFVTIPGIQEVTLIYNLQTNDPNQPFCTIYVTIDRSIEIVEEDHPFEKRKTAPSIGQVFIGQDQAKAKRAAGISTNLQNFSKAKLNSSIRLYPTMSRDEITIEQATNQGPKAYQIINLNAQVVQFGQLSGIGRETLSIRDLPEGMYFLKVKDTAKPLRFIKIE